MMKVQLGNKVIMLKVKFKSNINRVTTEKVDRGNAELPPIKIT